MDSNIMVKQWRRWTNNPEWPLRALVAVIIFGCSVYIFMYVYYWKLNRETLEMDYYDFVTSKLAEIETFQPKLFRASEKPTTLLDIENFRFAVNVPRPETWCLPMSGTGGKGRTLLIMVSSLLRNRKHRELIRNTWGSLLRIRNWKIKLVFVIGGRYVAKSQTNGDFKEENALRNEIARYEDIIMGNFKEDESPKHQLHYHLMGSKWALTYCSNAAYILRTSDTSFVDTFNVIEMIHYSYPRGILVCGMRHELDVGTRTTTVTIGKRKRSKSKPKSDYCRPEAMILSIDVVEILYLTMIRPPFFSTPKGKELTIPATGNQTFSSSFGPGSLQHSQMYSRDFLDERGIYVRNVAYKFVDVMKPALSWGLNRKATRDQKLPWTFVVLPDKIYVDEIKKIHKLWKKMVYVSSLVFEFRLSHTAKIGMKFASRIKKNFDNAVHKLEDL